MPSLIQKQKEKLSVVSVKKAYSSFSQAFKLAEITNGPIDTWDWSEELITEEGAAEIINAISPSLKIIKNCGIKIGEGCFPKGVYYKYLNGNNYAMYDNAKTLAKAKLADGTIFGIENYAKCDYVAGTTKELKNICGTVVVDINGDKRPNQIGVDTFWFWISKYGIIPFGAQEDTAYNFAADCTLQKRGYGCTAWVVFNENMDYLKCNDLDWDKKTSCK